MMLFQIESLDHVVINVVDKARSLHFYTKILGCELVRTIAEPELYQLRAGDALIDLKPVDALPERHNMDHFCLRIKPFDRDRLVTYLKNHRVPLGEVAVRNGAKGFGDSIYIEDPDGNRVELKAG